MTPSRALRQSRSIVPTLVASAFFLACSTAAQDDVETSELGRGEPYAPYPTELRPIRKLDGLDLQNASLANFGEGTRDQGSLASCASHGFLGLLENQLFVDRGISPDFAERYMLFSNFMSFANIGDQPSTIARFAETAARYGILPEPAYPYAAVNANGARFAQDLAQGLTDDPNAQTVDRAIAETAEHGRERSEVLQRSEFLGALPAGPRPVTIPLKAKLESGARVPEIEFEGGLYRCFSREGAAAEPEAKRFAMTPREFVRFCLDLEPKTMFTCKSDLEAISNAATPAGADECAAGNAQAAALGRYLAVTNAKWLRLIMALIDRGQSTMVGVQTPPEPVVKLGPLWSGRRFGFGGGHAVVVVGYVTYEELSSVDEQKRGLLGAGIFDRISAAGDPEYKALVDAGLPTDAAALRDVRRSSAVGRLLEQEGGLLLVRNSWGAKVGDHPIGLDGYQSMTFDYFLKAANLIQSRSQPRVSGVAWNLEAGPDACPQAIEPPVRDRWTTVDRSEAIAAALRAAVVPARCGP